MKKYFRLLLICLLLSIKTTNVSAKEFNVTSQNIILYNLNDFEVLYEERSMEKTKIASLTKIMTTLVGIEENPVLDESVTITKESLKDIYDYTKVGFKVGDVVTVRDLLYGTMLPSGADAANALAIHTSGSVDKFVDLMNAKAKELGLENTSFNNPIGKDADDNYSTASDIAKLLIYALKDPTFKDVFNSRKYTISSLGKTIESTLTFYSRAYGLDVTEITGAKSGYTDGAGICLASTSIIDDVNYLLVTLGANTKNKSNGIRDSLEIYDYYSSNYSYQTVIEEDTIIKSLPIKWGKTKTYDIVNEKDLKLYLENGIRKNKIKYEYKGIENINYKIKKNDKLGTVTIKYRDEEIDKFDVYLDKSLEFYHPVIYTIIIISIIIMYLSIKAILKKKKKKRIIKNTSRKK